MNVSCRSQKRIHPVFYEADHSASLKKKYAARIPVGYKLLIHSAEAWREYRYLYDDSAIVYLSDNGSVLNKANIKAAGFNKEKLKYNHFDEHESDSILLHGITNGLYWKEVTIGKLTYGYLNVLPNKIALFEAAMNSVKR